jgi:UDP-galactopyranose mutase
MVGPIAKLEPEALPRAPNIHYLGLKKYDELPAYLSGWDVAILPFALNAATRFISPTKTPEYLAAGRPVVSTPIADVVEPYERLGLVKIGRTSDGFVRAIEASLGGVDAANAGARDAFLARTSWDATWHLIAQQLERAQAGKFVSTGHGERESDPCSTI